MRNKKVWIVLAQDNSGDYACVFSTREKAVKWIKGIMADVDEDFTENESGTHWSSYNCDYYLEEQAIDQYDK